MLQHASIYDTEKRLAIDGHVRGTSSLPGFGPTESRRLHVTPRLRISYHRNQLLSNTQKLPGIYPSGTIWVF
ncbi:hypothetical protein QC764_121218 [Podospora pseudoanserina]|uniref:Uncharacterized protein n=1 Tax=Podospora pseudoanserina TaxID=2609844 RepID=A0ABR0ISA1_9PEZI|nr:hypothetical protein QC764_121218 [Podospora pseudoanserina]